MYRDNVINRNIGVIIMVIGRCAVCNEELTDTDLTFKTNDNKAILCDDGNCMEEYEKRKIEGN